VSIVFASYWTDGSFTRIGLELMAVAPDSLFDWLRIFGWLGHWLSSFVINWLGASLLLPGEEFSVLGNVGFDCSPVLSISILIGWRAVNEGVGTLGVGTAGKLDGIRGCTIKSKARQNLNPTRIGIFY
jgi:hypothetical protein